MPKTASKPKTRPSKDKLPKAPVHESAIKHVRGRAQYIDDLPEWPNTLHLAVGGSEHAHAKILNLNLDSVRSSSGVVAVYTARDVPGQLDIGPVYGGDPLLAPEIVEYVGQPIFIVAAESFAQAQRAVTKAEVEYQILSAQLDMELSVQQALFVRPTHTMKRGDADTALAHAQHRLSRQLYVRGQEHFYLEGQISLAQPTEDGGMHILTSSQHPSEVQKLVAGLLAIPIHKVQAEVRRMGGGFGGKETQAAPLACAAALVAHHTGRAAKFRMPRHQDMVSTGKRHDFLNKFDFGFDSEGQLQGVKIELYGKCGNSPDLSESIVDRAMFHSDNGYFLNQVTVTGYRPKTHTVSNTAFRGFGGPQGMLTAESMMDDIARHLQIDPLTVRKRNLYRPGFDETHYGQKIEQHVLPELISTLEDTADYWSRREEIKRFNLKHKYVKKGLALTPVKFGISFTAPHLNQAGALVHIYTDGSIHVNHGGTEMGQGLFTKVAQIVAKEFGVDFAAVMVSSTRTDKVPNTSPTAASAGTDLNGMAAHNACNNIKQRLLDFAVEHFTVAAEDVRFADNQVWLKESVMSFEEFIKTAYLARVSLSSTGFYQTPKIFYDRNTATGRPFYYFANGAAVSEVTVDTFTGAYKVERVDILQDVGTSINSAIDIGQIEGGFVQGMGWLTTEELLWNPQGEIISNSPANYKIPTAFDVPKEFNVALFHRQNNEATIYASKAVGEPPLMLAISVWCALRDACASEAQYQYNPPLDIPATPERVLWALKAARQYQASTP